ncbi:Glycine cleavage system transcriptional antiactivator GcvR [Salmonella enterica subsp. enterica serovar Give str. S5-487]|nr:Glycine cleavage system transcriptional antiactivator GcvR [Salmonella enterica subsp. enterica serovar Give str. S5-487]
MTPSSQHYLVITALGADRPGIVNTITRHVSSCGCNIEDSRLAMLGDEFTFIMLLSGTWNAITLIESTLPLKGAELDLLIVMKRTSDRDIVMKRTSSPTAPARQCPRRYGFRLRSPTPRI